MAKNSLTEISRCIDAMLSAVARERPLAGRRGVLVAVFFFEGRLVMVLGIRAREDHNGT